MNLIGGEKQSKNMNNWHISYKIRVRMKAKEINLSISVAG